MGDEKIAFSASCFVGEDGIFCERYDRNERIIDVKNVKEVRVGGIQSEATFHWGTKYIEVSLDRGSCFWDKGLEGKDTLVCDTEKFRE